MNHIFKNKKNIYVYNKLKKIKYNLLYQLNQSNQSGGALVSTQQNSNELTKVNPNNIQINLPYKGYQKRRNFLQ